MWGQKTSVRPNKVAMLSFLKENDIEMPETASISQIRSAFEALLFALDKSPRQAFDGTQPIDGGSADKEEQEETAKGDERDEEEEKCEEHRGNNVVGSGTAQWVDSVGKGVKSERLDKELELARMKLEILKMEMRNERVVEKPAEAEKIRLADISKIVGEFSGTSGHNVQKWLRLLETTIVSFGGGDKECYKIGRALLSGVARKTANKEIWCNWKALRDGLLESFPERRSAIVVYEELKKRLRRSGESSEEYVLAMEEIADDLIVETDLIPLVIVGLCGDSNFASMLAGSTTMRQLRSLLPAYDRISKLTGASRPIRVGAPASDNRRRICFNCKSEDGHIASQCPKPQARRPFSCFECGSVEHQVKACPKRQVGAVVEGDFVEPYTNVSAIFHLVTGSTKIYIKTLFDSGSPISLIEASNVPLSHPVHLAALEDFGYNGLGNMKLKSFGRINFDILKSNKITTVSAHVVPDSTLPCGLLLGRDSMQLFGVKLMQVDLVTPLEHLPIVDNWKELPENGMISAATYDIGPNRTKEAKEKIVDVIERNYAHFEGEMKTLNYEMNIVLENSTPIFSRPRRLSYAEKNQLRDIVQGLADEGIIRPSYSEYASPIVLVKKKSGELRMCVDYRGLNKVTKRDNYPIPLIDDCIDYLANKEIFSLLDLKSGFHQVKMGQNSIKYTSFVTPDGQWEYTRMPFGLKNAPSVFQRYINRIFRDFIDRGLIKIYLDDLLIGTKTMEEHLQVLAQILQRLSEYGLELQLKKCKFACDEIEYLGFIVCKDGIRPGREKTMAIEKFPVPKNAKEVHSFIGLCGYFRRFAKNFSTVSHPLQNLVKQNIPFDFDENCEKSFEEMKRILMNPPTLSIYDPRKETELHTDASAIGFGAVLLQKQTDSDQKWHPIAYFSKTTSEDEKKLHSYALETLAIYYALERFRIYLEGIDFTVVTDCNSLVQAIHKKDIHRSIGKWVCEFMNYNFMVKHRNGVNMGHVDALSRMPMIAAVDPTDIDIQLIALQSVDQTVLDLKSKLEKKTDSSFELSDGIVYKRGREGDLKFYVPKDLEHEVIRTGHEKCGHFGIAKTFEYLKRHYWFPEMKISIEKFIRNCIKCIIYSGPTKKNETHLYSIPKSPIPFDTVHLDHFGPLPSITSKKKHILVVTDAFTKHVKLYPVNATSTKEVICAMDKYFEYYDRPRRIVSDRGSCFTSVEFADFVKKYNIIHVKTATCAPQANGQVERVNRVLKAMLGKITTPVDNSDWVKRLKDVQFAINNTVSRSTGESPNVLLFGVQQKGFVVDYLTEHLSCVSEATRVDLKAIREEAAVNIKKSQDYANKWFQEHSKGPTYYDVGDLVYIQNVDTSPGNKKFIAKFKGPYRVAKVLPNDRYVISDVDGIQISQIPYDGVIEARNIRLWKRMDEK